MVAVVVVVVVVERRHLRVVEQTPEKGKSIVEAGVVGGLGVDGVLHGGIPEGVLHGVLFGVFGVLGDGVLGGLLRSSNWAPDVVHVRRRRRGDVTSLVRTPLLTTRVEEPLDKLVIFQDPARVVDGDGDVARS